MIGMYVEDWSGETDSTRIRGSTEAAAPSPPGTVPAAFVVVLLMSASPQSRTPSGPHSQKKNARGMETHSTAPWSGSPQARWELRARR